MDTEPRAAATEQQREAAQRFARARASFAAASQEHSAAYLACRKLGLEHRYDDRGRSKWPEVQGDWRPEHGEPIHV